MIKVTTDIAIVGGGLAGTLSAIMLGRAGFDVSLIDPHEVYPPEFRSEKIYEKHLELLGKIGVVEAVLRNTTQVDRMWVARGGVVEKRPEQQYGILYDVLVNAVRPLIPDSVSRHLSKATAIETSNDIQTVRLLNGEDIKSRVVVLATGLNNTFRQELGIARQELSKCHSISIGFNVSPIGGSSFKFPALTYYGERAADKVGYLTLFPIGTTMRANLFVYRDSKDPWLRELREQPARTIFAILPGLKKLTGEFAVEGLQIRPMDVYRTLGYERAGLVLVGDAFATSCPAAGTGIAKVLLDTERLCHAYIPQWLATPGMSSEKTCSFYEDQAKIENDSQSLESAFYERSAAIDQSLTWRARRSLKVVKLLAANLGLRGVIQSLSLAMANLRVAKGPVFK
jgi:2-polyprenyl-6-methoxyphenol hydroxylase-like FAD-dependent oxidoreductase